MTVTLEEIKSFVHLALEKECEGGTVLAFYIPPENDPEQRGIKFEHGSRVPRSVPKADAMAATIWAGIELNWKASDRKRARVYTLQILTAAKVIEHQRTIVFAPEPVRVEDIQNKALETGMLALQSAQDRIAVPFDLMRDMLEGVRGDARAQHAADQKEIADLRARVHELEKERGGAVDRLLTWQREASEAAVQSATADAIRAEGAAKAGAWDKLGTTVAQSTPTVLALGLRALAAKGILPGLPGVAPGPKYMAPGAAVPTASPAAPAAGAPPPAPAGGGVRFTPPPKPMSGESAAMVRALGAALDDAELSGLVKFAYDADPNGGVLFRVLREENVNRVIALVGRLATEWGIE